MAKKIEMVRELVDEEMSVRAMRAEWAEKKLKKFVKAVLCMSFGKPTINPNGRYWELYWQIEPTHSLKRNRLRHLIDIAKSDVSGMYKGSEDEGGEKIEYTVSAWYHDRVCISIKYSRS